MQHDRRARGDSRHRRQRRHGRGTPLLLLGCALACAPGGAAPRDPPRPAPALDFPQPASAPAIAPPPSPAAHTTPRPELTTDGRYAMASVLEITLVGLPAARAERLLDALYSEVRHIEDVVAHRDPTSQLAALNRAAGGAVAQPVAPHLVALLRQSARYRDLTGGAFDISVGPWLHLWERAARRDRLPSPEERGRIHPRVGARAFRVDPAGRVALAPGASLDLGGIAKGYALDQLAARLRREAPAPTAALLNFGQSSYWALGNAPGGGPWTLLLRNPRSLHADPPRGVHADHPRGVHADHPEGRHAGNPEGRHADRPEDGYADSPRSGYAGTIELRGHGTLARALSVSASLGRSSRIRGRRYGHIIDPRSGEPLLRSAQVAVVAPRAALAEALSTALLVLGPTDGLALIDRLPDCEALWLDARGARPSRAWHTATHYRPLPPPPHPPSPAARPVAR